MHLCSYSSSGREIPVFADPRLRPALRIPFLIWVHVIPDQICVPQDCVPLQHISPDARLATVSVTAAGGTCPRKAATKNVFVDTEFNEVSKLVISQYAAAFFHRSSFRKNYHFQPLGAKVWLKLGDFMSDSWSPRVGVLYGKAIFVELWRISCDQTGELLAQSVDHVQVTVRAIIPSQANVGAGGLCIGGVDLQN